MLPPPHGFLSLSVSHLGGQRVGEEAACSKELILILACFFKEKWMVCSSL